MESRHHILVGLGGNLPSASGNPGDTICAAIDILRASEIDDIAVSGFYQTSPMPRSDQPDFVNCAVAAKTALSAQDTLALFKSTEKKLGRVPAERWSARTIDIDLLAHGDAVLPDRQAWNEIAYSDDPTAFLELPTVPHPRLHKRAFVLLPLLEVAPHWRHPCLNISVAEMAKKRVIKAQGSSVRKISANS